MPLSNIPETAEEIDAKAKADVQRELTTSNPFLKNSWLGAIITGYANRIFDFYIQLLIALAQSLPDTAVGEYLTRWAAIWGKQLIAASQANGNVVATGTATTAIPAGTIFTITSGNYTSTSLATISTQVVNLDSLTRVGQIATATTANDHGLANDVSATVAGASNSEYNITADITVTGDDAFQYTVAGSPADEPSTSATVTFTTASVPVLSDDFGAATNLDAGTKLSLQSPIVGVDTAVTVDFGAIGGGTDLESEDSLRDRMLDRIQNPVAHFNAAEIEEKAREVAGVTRVFVQEARTEIDTSAITSITRSGTIATATLTSAENFISGQTTTITGAVEGDYNVTNGMILVESTTVFHYVVANSPTTPATGTIEATVSVGLGQLIVYFMRDNDLNPIPTASEVTKVKDKILEIKPANTGDIDVSVLAPVGVAVDFTFTDLTPNTATMQDAIEANLRQFFDERTTVGVNIDEDAYRSAIFNTVDPATGDVVRTFTLSAPSGDVVIAVGEIGILGL